MLARIGRYSLVVVLTFFSVSLLVFALIWNSAGDSSAYILSEDAGSGEIAEYRASAGLDKSFWDSYLHFILSFITGRWGHTAAGHDIKLLISHSVPVTLSLAFLSLLLAIIISVPLSVIGAGNRAAGYAVSGLSVVLMVLPSFLMAMFLVSVFSMKLKIFPVAGYIPPSRGFVPYLRSLFLPSLTLAFLHASLYMRVFRKALREGVESQYSLFALSMGMRKKDLAVKSAMKPALPVLLSLISQSLVSAIGGAAVVETVYSLPGIGSLLVDAALSRDGQLAGTIMILLSLSASIIFFFLEGILPAIDPRIRRSR